MAAPPAKRARPAQGTDADMLLEVLSRHVHVPINLKYREVLAGPQDKQEIAKHTDLLKDLPRTVAQLPLVTALKALATKKEDVWHLAAEKTAWATVTARQLRAMNRDVAQALVKAKGKEKAGPDWLRPFLTTVEQEGGRVMEGPISIQGNSDTEGKDQDKEAKEDQTQKDKDTAGSHYKIGWDDDMQVG